MRIAQVSPLYESVPPKLYGGTERIVSYLTEALVKQGHEVTLFASGDSQTSARLIACGKEALRLGGSIDPMPHHYVMMEKLGRYHQEFDIIHFHIDYYHYPWTRRYQWPHITTLHGRVDLPDQLPVYGEYAEMPVTAISYSQQNTQPGLNWVDTIHHGLPRNLYKFYPNKGQYLAFLGRVSPEKGLSRAIEIAKAAGIPLKIAAKIDKHDEKYFKEVLTPMLDHPLIEFIGEIGEKDKNEFLGNAMALLFLINWPEPFGLVMIEALACGTPVIAYGHGSVPEIIDDGLTGYIVHSQQEALKAVHKISIISRVDCRRVFEQRFTDEQMALSYVHTYNNVLALKNQETLMV